MEANQRILLDIHDLRKEYPVLSIWAINNAIKNYNMPVIRIGRKRYFNKDSIELWLKNLERKEDKDNE